MGIAECQAGEGSSARRSFIDGGTGLKGHAIAITWTRGLVVGPNLFCTTGQTLVDRTFERRIPPFPFPRTGAHSSTSNQREITDLTPGKRTVLVVPHLGLRAVLA